ncbi:hypothetical protein FRB94_007152 [Tulasnella sp. JGI-2019a]|nr:hypothetical protein FRB93_012472 [Tulasnella sp. JGI-2019a]KAG9011959.1 hypothetical protein FRB94_007152 [Tulasnella sp. JGI-2019a]KAG9036269.1 hypothetical protein FRB95_009417 [Tulasnella sp. JGI-2019a]
MDSSSKFPEYYVLLNIPRTASTEDVRTAYKRESLRTHPDRLQKATPAEKKAATERFQAVADAYYVLSDPARRREYDILLQSRPTSSQTSDPSASNNFFADFAKYFSGGTGTGTSSAQEGKPSEFANGAYGPGVAPERPNPDGVFTDVFEELLRPEVESRVPLWSWLGTASGAGIGFIMANIPGALVGGAAGNRLGAIRDAKGKPVGQVFMQLGGNQKAEILRLLAKKVLGSVL